MSLAARLALLEAKLAATFESRYDKVQAMLYRIVDTLEKRN
jgi:hypothetical protein